MCLPSLRALLGHHQLGLHLEVGLSRRSFPLALPRSLPDCLLPHLSSAFRVGPEGGCSASCRNPLHTHGVLLFLLSPVSSLPPFPPCPSPRLWDVETGQELLLQDGHYKETHAIAFQVGREGRRGEGVHWAGWTIQIVGIGTPCLRQMDRGLSSSRH